jgi:hypothetical protein
MIENPEPSGIAPTIVPKRDLVKSLEFGAAILLSAMMIFFLAVRATHAGALWRDEAAMLQLAQMPTVGEITANFQHEAFPIPFPLLIRGYTTVFGSSDAALRWFGFAVGIGIIAAAWFNSRALGDHGPLIFLVLFGLNATFLIFGTSLRGYGLGCVFLILAIGLTAKALQQPSSRNTVVATVAAVVSVQFMVNAVPLVAAIAGSAVIVFVLQKQYRRAAIVCICGGICALSFVPYLHSYLGADWNIVLKYPTDFSSLSDKLRLALQEYGPASALFWYLAILLVIIAAISRWVLQRKAASVEATLLIFPISVVVLSILAYYAFLKTLSYATRSWYYLPLLCAVAAGAELAGAILARAQWFRIVRLLFAAAAFLSLPLSLWNAAHERLTDIDIIAQKLEQEAGPNDLIVLNPWHFAPSFYRYYHGSTPWITVPTMSEHRVHRYDLMKAKMLEDDPLSDVRTRIQQTLQSDHRVWIVGGARPLDPNMPRLGPAPNPYFGWAGYMSFWSMEIGSFLGAHTDGEVVLAPMPNVNDGENVPLLMAHGWQN